MLTFQQHSPHLLLPYPSSSFLCLHRRREPPSASSSSSSSAAAKPQETVPLRKHNAKSTALLRRHLSPRPPDPIQQETPENNPKAISAAVDDERARALEISLFSKRSPKFPGSIDHDAGSASLPPLQRLSRGGDEDEDEVLMRALEIRRSVTVEILKDAMQSGKFGITYASNLVSRVPDFIDYVMVEAAAMKRLPEFSHSPYHFRAKNVISNSNVVPLIRWLKHHSLSFPQIAKLICSSAGNLDGIKRVVLWLKSNHVKDEFLGVALTKSGGNILDRRIEELEEIVGYLESKGVIKDWMGFVISRCPKLLSYTIDEVKTRVNFYLDMGMNEKDFGTMVYDYPKALGFLTLEEMNLKANYLKEFGLDIKGVGRLLAFKPQLMGCSIKERWKPLIKYLYYLGVDQDGMRRILVKKPVVFCIDLETILVPKVQFFQDIGVQEDAIGKMLVKFPPLLTYSLHKKIRPVVIFLITRAGVSKENVGKVVALEPELLGCSIVHKLEVGLKYFLSLGIPLQQLGEMITDFPTLLRYNVDLLRPKYLYLRRSMVRPLQDLIGFPRFFSYSLEDRIIPRHRVLVENHVNFKLHCMLACTDDEFENRVKEAVERRHSFESGPANEVFSDAQAIQHPVEDGSL